MYLARTGIQNTRRSMQMLCERRACLNEGLPTRAGSALRQLWGQHRTKAQPTTSLRWKSAALENGQDLQRTFIHRQTRGTDGLHPSLSRDEQVAFNRER